MANEESLQAEVLMSVTAPQATRMLRKKDFMATLPAPLWPALAR
jgi:hypothetical protein